LKFVTSHKFLQNFT